MWDSFFSSESEDSDEVSELEATVFRDPEGLPKARGFCKQKSDADADSRAYLLGAWVGVVVGFQWVREADGLIQLVSWHVVLATTDLHQRFRQYAAAFFRVRAHDPDKERELRERDTPQLTCTPEGQSVEGRASVCSDPEGYAAANQSAK